MLSSSALASEVSWASQDVASSSGENEWHHAEKSTDG